MSATVGFLGPLAVENGLYFAGACAGRALCTCVRPALCACVADVLPAWHAPNPADAARVYRACCRRLIACAAFAGLQYLGAAPPLVIAFWVLFIATSVQTAVAEFDGFW